MNQLKRFPIKYIRDFIKKDYKLRDECFICGSKEKLIKSRIRKNCSPKHVPAIII